VIVAKELGTSLGWSQFVVGSVIVALGTSTPELVTTLISVRRGHVGVGIGNVLGSNIFNSLFIIGIAGTIEPINVEWRSSSMALFGALVACIIIIPRPNRPYSRKLGIVLIALYATYLCGLLLI
jgi:cation:H+ antiporter